MNELTITPDTPSKPNLLDNKLIMLLPLLFVFKGLVQNNEISLSSISPQINIDLNSLRELLTLDNLNSKISTLKKVGPFLPEPTINTLNKALLTYEKVSRIVELVEFLNTSKSFNPISPVKTTGSKDMINQVFMAIEDDLPDDKLKVVKPAIDIITNFDKYVGMINMVSSLLSNTNGKSENKVEDLMDIAKPLLGGDEDKSNDKMKDMMQMVEILNILSTPEKKEDKKEDKAE